MHKYWIIFTLSWQEEFTYRINFVLWRVRNVIKFLMIYFLWSGIFIANQSVYGYSKPQLLAYAFLLLLISTVVMSSPSSDNIGGEISSGDLGNYLVKPMHYLRYWFCRDLSSKLLNICFASIELMLLYLLLKPALHLSLNEVTIFSFFISLIIAVVLYFLISSLTRFVSFWSPENTWPVAFLLSVIIELVSGGIFPLDILPDNIQHIMMFTPFPYLLYYPIAILIGKIEGIQILHVLLLGLCWVGLMMLITQYVWSKGLRIYASEGR
jgi:ABC-2 type transport system permease protein